MSGKKFDNGKAPVFRGCIAYFPDALKAVAEVSAYGAKKYNVPYWDKNWKRVEDAEGRYKDALLRHVMDMDFTTLDPESGLRHLAHAAWNALAVLQLELERQAAACKTADIDVTLKSDDFYQDNPEQLWEKLQRSSR